MGRDEDTLHVVYVAQTINHWSPGIRFANLPREMIESANKETRKVGKHIVDAYMTTLHKKKIPHCKIDVLSPDPQKPSPWPPCTSSTTTTSHTRSWGQGGRRLWGRQTAKKTRCWVRSLTTSWRMPSVA